MSYFDRRPPPPPEPTSFTGRRNPQSANPRRTGGPPAPPSPREAAKARKRWLANFRRTRGFPEGTDLDYIEVCRRHGIWYKGIRPPDD